MTVAPLRFARRRDRQRGRGQALAELAIVLPVAFVLFALTIDLARAYGAWTTLEGATRNAAEAGVRARDPLTATVAARQAMCTEMAGVEGYAETGGTCTSPTLSMRWGSGPMPAGEQGTVVRVVVNTEFSFPTIVPWPMVTRGGMVLLGSRSHLERLHR